MNPNDLFSIANLIAMIGWLMLIFAPKWKWTQQIVFSGGIVLLFAIGYLFYFIFGVGGIDLSSFSTLDGVMALFTQPEAVLVGWLHYLAFDLFVGMWEVKNAEKHGIPHLAVIPCLLLTFMFGPVGLLVYFIIRWAIKRQRVSNF